MNESSGYSLVCSRRDFHLYDDNFIPFSRHGAELRAPGRHAGVGFPWRRSAATAMTDAEHRQTQEPQWQAAFFDASPRSVREARKFVASLVRQPAMRETGELLVSELTTNALRHARGPFEVRVQAGPRVRVEVRDGSTQRPTLKDADATDEGGRGLHIVRQLAKAWGTEERADGKVVWFEL